MAMSLKMFIERVEAKALISVSRIPDAELADLGEDREVLVSSQYGVLYGLDEDCWTDGEVCEGEPTRFVLVDRGNRVPAADADATGIRWKEWADA